MKKTLSHTVQVHRVSSIARTASLLGSCMAAGIGTVATASELNPYDVLPWDGNGGGTGNTIFMPGGTQAITTTSTVTTKRASDRKESSPAVAKDCATRQNTPKGKTCMIRSVITNIV